MSSFKINSKSKTLKGITVSPGIEIGKVWKVIECDNEIQSQPHSISNNDIEKELIKLENAIRLSKEQLENLYLVVEQKLGVKEANIFKAHILILEDPHFLDTIKETLKREKKNIEYIVNEVVKKFSLTFASLDDKLMKERSADIRDVGVRILKNLINEKHTLLEPNEKVIIVAKELVPSITVKASSNILGFVVEHGEIMSHAAILARSLNIPAIVGVENICNEVVTGDTIILDGTNSIVITNPSNKTISEYKRNQLEYLVIKKDFKQISKLPSITTDGQTIHLLANINKINDIELAKEYNAQGIGLFRTEFFFMSMDHFPNEEEQYQLYKQVISNFPNHECTIRVLDIGADKTLSYFTTYQESNPQLGLRGIRFLLNEISIFKTQIKAILRASNLGKIKLLIPMISSISELIEVRDIIEESKFELKNKFQYDIKVELGAMIEVPASVFIIDEVLNYVSFVSIGTNDLIQYLLAVDRNNSKVANFYEPLHPAVLRAIKHVVDSASKQNKEVVLCGELAGDTLFTMILLGLGIKKLSMNPIAIPSVLKVVRSVSLTKCKAIANTLLQMSCMNEAKKFLKENVLTFLENLHS